jgi:hypothetical protein
MPPVQFLQDNRYRFIVWAPEKGRMILHIVAPFDSEFPMQKDESGNFLVEITSGEKNLNAGQTVTLLPLSVAVYHS